jgi:hypothetical protein
LPLVFYSARETGFLRGGPQYPAGVTKGEGERSRKAELETAATPVHGAEEMGILCNERFQWR